LARPIADLILVLRLLLLSSARSMQCRAATSTFSPPRSGCRSSRPLAGASAHSTLLPALRNFAMPGGLARWICR